MKLIVTRFLSLPRCFASEITFGSSEHICYAIERLVWDRGIPDGVYGTEITYSPRFKRRLPWINVPGRTGIRFHGGNWINQSDGCVLTGTSVTVLPGEAVTADSQKALTKLMEMYKKYAIKEVIFTTR